MAAWVAVVGRLREELIEEAELLAQVKHADDEATDGLAHHVVPEGLARFRRRVEELARPLQQPANEGRHPETPHGEWAAGRGRPNGGQRVVGWRCAQTCDGGLR